MVEAKIKFFQVCPESVTFRNNKEDFYQYEKAEETSWKNIPSCCFEACVESMPRRGKAVINATGWFPKR